MAAVVPAYTEEGRHLTLAELNELTNNPYLDKISPRNGNNIPAYPRPELHVTHVSHSTDRKALQRIRAKRGFRSPNYGGPKVVWFSLTVTPEDLSMAETRNMKIVRPGGVEEELSPMEAYGGYWGWEEEEVLRTFASSPAFLSSSRYGSYRFTFDLMDVLDEYSDQFCDGMTPVMRMWKTELYRQEVMYAVLVHSPDDYRFSRLPLLEETPHSICAYSEPYFLWRPQAMCKTHRFELVESPGELFPVHLHNEEYFVWDHVALALVVDDQVLEFSGRKLWRSLRFCEQDEVKVHPSVMFEPYYRANGAVRRLWPHMGNLRRFDESYLHII